jgi:hypothetical protein
MIWGTPRVILFLFRQPKPERAIAMGHHEYADRLLVIERFGVPISRKNHRGHVKIPYIKTLCQYINVKTMYYAIYSVLMPFLTRRGKLEDPGLLALP